MFQRQPMDMEAYQRRVRTGPCFICEIVAGNPEYPHHIVYEDDDAIVFLNKYLYRVAEALRQVVPTERVYILTLGSQQGNRHVHWHIVPLPPGVPYEQQQVEALRMDKGVLKLSDQEMTSLALRIRQEMERI